MKKIYLTKVLLVSMVLTSFGQKSWSDKFNGLVVTQDNLVIEGYLKFGVGITDRGMKIMLQKEPNDTPQIFYTLDLKGYVYKKDTFRIIHNLQPYLDDNKVIDRAEARIVQNGRLVLYEIPEVYYSQTFIVTADNRATSMPIAHTAYIYVVLDTKGEMNGVKKENFINEMHKLLNDAPDILEKIDNKVLKFKDLEKIIREYNRKF